MAMAEERQDPRQRQGVVCYALADHEGHSACCSGFSDALVPSFVTVSGGTRESYPTY
jgi:hypothetical protein